MQSDLEGIEESLDVLEDLSLGVVHADRLCHVAMVTDCQVTDVVSEHTTQGPSGVDELLDAIQFRLHTWRISSYVYSCFWSTHSIGAS